MPTSKSYTPFNHSLCTHCTTTHYIHTIQPLTKYTHTIEYTLHPITHSIHTIQPLTLYTPFNHTLHRYHPTTQYIIHTMLILVGVEYTAHKLKYFLFFLIRLYAYELQLMVHYCKYTDTISFKPIKYQCAKTVTGVNAFNINVSMAQRNFHYVRRDAGNK